MLNGLGLFSGIEGFTIALAPWVRPIAYCDIEKYTRSVLLDRMAARELPVAPIWDDVRTLRKEHIPVPVDIIYGGFPCQDISVAGNGIGLAGKRSGLFFEVVRLAREFRPSFIFLENVPALTVRGLETVLLEITALGYDCRWDIISAQEVGAPHKRERIWITAYSDSNRIRAQQESEFRQSKTKPELVCEDDILDPISEGLERWRLAETAWETFRFGRSTSEQQWPQWLPKPTIRGGIDGLPHRVDRIKALGNAVVPQACQKAFTSFFKFI